MLRTIPAVLALLALTLPQEPAPPEAPLVKKLTPVLHCATVEPCLDFWVGQLGFEVTLSVPPGEGPMAFAMLTQGSVEVMLQSYASLDEDLPALAESARSQQTFLFLEVADLDAVEARLGQTEIVVSRRETFYGSTEISVRTPGGHYVTLAQMSED